MTDCNQFTIFEKVAEISKHDLFAITGNEHRLFPAIKDSSLRKILKIFQLIICHVELGLKILKNRNKDAIIIHGFSTEFLIFTYIFSLFRAKNVYVLTHHNIQQAFHSPISRLLFKIYYSCGYRFIVNETSSMLNCIGFSEQESRQHISLPHPVVGIDDATIRNSKELIQQIDGNKINQKKIGIVGKIRQGKQVSETLNFLMQLQDKLDFLLVIGTDDFSPMSNIRSDKIELLDTSTKDSYLSVLALCDIVVLNYDESKYLYRCSGVAADAIGARTYVVCPNFPVMSNQLNYPAQVGILYHNESDLEMAIEQALELAPAAENAAFESHYRERSIENLASALAQDIQAQLSQSGRVLRSSVRFWQ
jgi:hypothetical protein